MKRVLLLALFVLGTTIITDAQENKPFVHCLLLDKTMSMTGHGGDNIWNDVQDYCYGWVDGIDLNSTVLFFTYDKDLTGPVVFTINSETDRDKVKEAIKTVKVDGRYTWIASNLKKVVDYAYEKYPDNNKMIYLITDGKEEQPGSDFVGVLNEYDHRSSDYDHLYYVDLNGKADPRVVDAINHSEHSSIGTGFVKFYTFKPVFEELNYVIGESSPLEQHFIVSKSEDLPESLSFTFKADSIENIGEGNGTANVSLSPTKVSVGRMTELEEGKYKVDLVVNFINNSERECDIHVVVDGETRGDKSITSNPSSFVIKARNKARPTVKIKVGWH